MLHCAAASSNKVESFQLLLAHYPESERLRALSLQDKKGWTVLHSVARSGSFELIEIILALYPESERLQAVSTQDQHERTVLHCALYSNKVECIKAVLSIYSAPQRLHALDTALGSRKKRGRTQRNSAQFRCRQKLNSVSVSYILKLSGRSAALEKQKTT